MTGTLRGLTTTAMSIAVVAIMAACDAPTDGAPSSPGHATTSNPTPPTASATKSEIDLPFANFLRLQPKLGAAVDRAISNDILECVRSAGFSVPQPSHPDTVEHDPITRRYGLPGRQRLAATGYRQSSATESEASNPMADPSLATTIFGSADHQIQVIALVDAEGNEIGAVSSSGGCLGQAQEHLFGDFEAYADYVQTLSSLERMASDTYQRTLASPELAALNEQWNNCMTAAGFEEYSTPEQALNADWRSTADEPSDDEIRTSLADWDCRAELGYETQALRIEGKFQSESNDQYTNYMRQLDAYVRQLPNL